MAVDRVGVGGLAPTVTATYFDDKGNKLREDANLPTNAQWTAPVQETMRGMDETIGKQRLAQYQAQLAASGRLQQNPTTAGEAVAAQDAITQYNESKQKEKQKSVIDTILRGMPDASNYTGLFSDLFKG